jgi:hypothetical protein
MSSILSGLSIHNVYETEICRFFFATYRVPPALKQPSDETLRPIYIKFCMVSDPVNLVRLSPLKYSLIKKNIRPA